MVQNRIITEKKVFWDHFGRQTAPRSLCGVGGGQSWQPFLQLFCLFFIPYRDIVVFFGIGAKFTLFFGFLFEFQLKAGQAKGQASIAAPKTGSKMSSLPPECTSKDACGQPTVLRCPHHEDHSDHPRSQAANSKGVAQRSPRGAKSRFFLNSSTESSTK